jgi:low temperature requirement protein LtrA
VTEARQRGGPLRVSGPPQHREDESRGDRHSSNMELFFDLVFALAVTELGEALVSRPTVAAMVRLALLFVPVWWAWVGYTFYADRFESDDASYRILMITAMVATTWLVVAIPHAFERGGGSIRFALSYVLVRLLLITLYGRAYRHMPAARPLIVRYVTGFGIGAGLWLCSLLVPPPARYLLWGAGLLCELTPPVVSARAMRQAPFHPAHIPERFGNFIIVVLGEGGALGGLRIVTGPLTWDTIAVAGVGLLIAAAQWWLYFDCVDATPLRRWVPTGITYVYGHLLVFGGLITTGVGVMLSTLIAAGAPAGPSARIALCAGPAMFVVAIGVIHLTNVLPHGDARGWSRLATGTALAGLAPLSAGAPPLVIELVILAALAGQTALELRLPPCPHLLRRSPAGSACGPAESCVGVDGGAPRPAR